MSTPGVITTDTNMDLKPYIGRNILPEPGDVTDPFCGEVPNDAKGYSQYRSHYEGVMDDVMAMQDGMKLTLEFNCETTSENGEMRRMSGKKPGHEGAGVVYACHHVIHQDQVNPDGIEFVPTKRGSGGGYYLCKICSKALERRRLPLTQIYGKCSKCVLETVMRINATHPHRLVNLTTV